MASQNIPVNSIKEEIRESNGPADNKMKHQDNRRGGGHSRGRNHPHKGGDIKNEGRELREIPVRGGHGGGGGRGRDRGGPANRDASRSNESPFLNERSLKAISGPTVDLPSQEYKEKKFNNRCRLYIGNLSPETTEEEFKSLFEPYGETNEVFISKDKNFAFVRLDYRSTAEKAKRELDGKIVKNRNLKVRFAPLGSTIKVKNLANYVTNELLELAFSIFGEIERAIVTVDDRGNSLREGTVEFKRKGSALSAIRFCHENCFFLTSSLKPAIVEPFEFTEDTDGYSEKMVLKKTPDYFQAREVGPRFANMGSFEHEFGTRWKQIYELYKQKEEALKREKKLEEEKLEAQLKYAKYEHETELLREQLRQREMDRERQKREWELKERQAEEQRVAEEEALRRHQEDLSRRMMHQEDELRRRQQENSIFMQGENGKRNADNYTNNVPGSLRMEYEAALQGSSSRQSQEAVFEAYAAAAAAVTGGRDRGVFDNGGGRMPEDLASRRPGSGASPAQPSSRWPHQDHRSRQPADDFPSKRRRY